jgi:hypothetical protein
MNARFPHPSARKDASAAGHAPGGATIARGVPAGLAELACCCPARPVVRVVMPPVPARPHETELLLCGHHYRVSRQALAAAHAAVCEMPGTPADTTALLDLDEHGSPAPVS